jgi:hypothetical protein
VKTLRRRLHAIVAMQDLTNRNPHRAKYWVELLVLYDAAGNERMYAEALTKACKSDRFFDTLLSNRAGADPAATQKPPARRGVRPIL